MAILKDQKLIDLETALEEYVKDLDTNGSSNLWPILNGAIRDAINQAHYDGGEIAHVPQDLMDELRQAILDGAPLVSLSGSNLDTLAEKMKIDDDVIVMAAISFVCATHPLVNHPLFKLDFIKDEMDTGDESD